MLSNPRSGWADLNFGEFHSLVSYLTDVLEDVVDAAETYIGKNERKCPIALRFDAEDEGDRLLVINYGCTHLIADAETPSLFTKEIDSDAMITELLRDMERDLHDWVFCFELWGDGVALEAREAELRERIKAALEKITEEVIATPK